MHKSIALMLFLSFGITATQAAQLPQQSASVQKEASIIKNVAASLKTPNSPVTSNKHSALEQLLQDAQTKQSIIVSPEESRALARLNTRSSNIPFIQNKNLSSIFQRLFGG